MVQISRKILKIQKNLILNTNFCNVYFNANFAKTGVLKNKFLSKDFSLSRIGILIKF